MNNKIQISITLSVDSPPPVVIVDAPNVYYDNYCKKHNLRECDKCKKEMIDLGIIKKRGKREYADTNNKKWFTRSLEISRLEIVVDFIVKRGYQPLLYCESGMRDYLNGWALKKYPDEVPQKRDMLSSLVESKYVIFDDHGKKPHGSNKEENENWDDDIWIIHMALQLREEYDTESFIMSNDGFYAWRKNRTDLDWGLIDTIQVKFEWQPKIAEFKDPTDQIFLAPKLKKIVEAKPSIEMKRIRTEIRKLDQRKKELMLKLQSLEHKETLLMALQDKSISTHMGPISEREIPHKEEIINTFEGALQDGQRKDWIYVENLWHHLSQNGIGDRLAYSNPPGLNHYAILSHKSRAKSMMGFKEDSPDLAFLQFLTNVFMDETGKELKPNEDWSELHLVD